MKYVKIFAVCTVMAFVFYFIMFSIYAITCLKPPKKQQPHPLTYNANIVEKITPDFSGVFYLVTK